MNPAEIQHVWLLYTVTLKTVSFDPSYIQFQSSWVMPALFNISV